MEVYMSHLDINSPNSPYEHHDFHWPLNTSDYSALVKCLFNYLLVLFTWVYISSTFGNYRFLSEKSISPFLHFSSAAILIPPCFPGRWNIFTHFPTSSYFTTKQKSQGMGWVLLHTICESVKEIKISGFQFCFHFL